MQLHYLRAPVWVSTNDQNEFEREKNYTVFINLYFEVCVIAKLSGVIAIITV